MDNIIRSCKFFLRTSILTGFLAGPCLGMAAGPFDKWVWRNPQPFCPQLQSVTHGGGLWIVFGNVGVAATSVDAIAWDLAVLRTNAASISGAYGNGRFVAGTSRGIFYSFDGHSWSPSLNGANLSDLCFGNDLFAGVTGNTIWRSINGSNWTSVTAGATVQFSRISFANGRLFALGTDLSSSTLYTSTDATNWNGPIALGTNGMQKIAFGNGVYVGLNPVVASTNFWTEFRTSSDGLAWSAPAILTNTYVADIIFVNGNFIALDEIGGTLSSPDGANWQGHSAPELFASTKIDWNGSILVACGLGGRIVTSTDALAWTRRTTGPQNSLVSIIRTNGLFLAVGGNQFDPYAQSTVITSSDGRNWREHSPSTTNSLTSVAFGAGQYVAAGLSGIIVTSADATNWNPVSSPTTNLLYSVAVGAGQFVAVGGTTNRATILSSSNGLDWSAQTDGTTYTTLFGVSYLQGKFIAVGQTNGAKLATMLSSLDGLSWTSQVSMASNHLRAVTYANGIYVAVGDRGTIVNSADGVSWTNVSLGTVLSWRAVAYANGQYVALCSSPPAYAASTNAVNWTLSTALSSITLQPLYGIVSGSNSFFVAGYQGEVLESLPFIPADPEATLALRKAEQTLLSFSGPEYHGYEIQGSDVLPPSWQALVTITNASSTTTLPVSAGTNFSSHFYRIRLLD